MLRMLRMGILKDFFRMRYLFPPELGNDVFEFLIEGEKPLFLLSCSVFD